MRAQSQYGQVPECFLGRNPGMLINQRAYNKRPMPNAEMDVDGIETSAGLCQVVLVCVSLCVLLHVILIKYFIVIALHCI